MVDLSVGMRVIRNRMVTQGAESDLDRCGPFDRRNTLRPMSLLDCIEYEMNLRGSLPALYSLGGRVIGRLDLDLFSYMVSIYKEYDIYHIRTDPSVSLRFF